MDLLGIVIIGVVLGVVSVIINRLMKRGMLGAASVTDNALTAMGVATPEQHREAQFAAMATGLEVGATLAGAQTIVDAVVSAKPRAYSTQGERIYGITFLGKPDMIVELIEHGEKSMLRMVSFYAGNGNPQSPPDWKSLCQRVAKQASSEGVETSEVSGVSEFVTVGERGHETRYSVER